MTWFKEDLKTAMTDKQIEQFKMYFLMQQMKFTELGYHDRAEAIKKIRFLLK